jgi:hypothetical protein
VFCCAAALLNSVPARDAKSNAATNGVRLALSRIRSTASPSPRLDEVAGATTVLDGAGIVVMVRPPAVG